MEISDNEGVAREAGRDTASSQFVEALAEILKTKGWSLADLAREIGISREAVAQVFDRRRGLSFRTAERYAAGLGLSVSFVLVPNKLADSGSKQSGGGIARTKGLWNESALSKRIGKNRNEMKAAVPPVIDPEDFERFEGFRETTLALITDEEGNTTLRRMADFILTVSREYSRYWPDEPEGYVNHYCRAVVADLRHLEGSLAMLSEIRESEISKVCEKLYPRVKKIADALEKALDEFEEDEE